MILISVKSEVVNDKRQFKSDRKALTFLKRIKKLHDTHRKNIAGAKPPLKQVGGKKALSERLSEVEIFNRDAIELILMKDTPDTFFYFDPPYAESDCGQYNSLKSVYYKLLDILPDLKGKFLMSSYPSDLLTELRKDNNWRSKDIVQNLSVSGKQTKGKTKTECLTWNYDLIGAGTQTPLF